MIKPMLTVSIKEHLSPSWKKFDLLLSSATRDNKIVHIFVVDIEFDKKNIYICDNKRIFT